MRKFKHWRPSAKTIKHKRPEMLFTRKHSFNNLFRTQEICIAIMYIDKGKMIIYYLSIFFILF